MPAARYYWVLAFADGALSTPEVYGTLDRLRAADGRAGKAAEPELSTELMTALRAGDLERLGRSLSNDLQAPAISLFPAPAQDARRRPRTGALGDRFWGRVRPACSPRATPGTRRCVVVPSGAASAATATPASGAGAHW